MNTINPTFKALGLLLPTFFLAAMQKPFLNLAIFALSLILLAVSHVNFKILTATMIPVMITALGTFYTGYRFQSGNGMPVSELSFHLADSSAWNGLILASRVLAFAGLGLLLALTTDRVRLVQSLNQQLKLPPVFAYGLLAAWGILPVMVREYRQTRAAFRARGLRVLPVSASLLKPMLVKAVRWAEALSVAMESKGFAANAARTVYHPVPVRSRDYLFLILVALGCTGIVFLP